MVKPVPITRRVADSLTNFVSGLMTSKDKNYHTQYAFRELNEAQLLAAYRGDWIARKAVDIPAQDATREWRTWQADASAVDAIEAQERLFNVQQKCFHALVRARLYGGGLLVMGLKDQRPEDPLIIDSVQQGSLQYLHVLSRFEVSVSELRYDPLDPWHGEPVDYQITTEKAGTIKIHPSRVVRIIGREIPDYRVRNQGWGDSVLQAIDDAIKNAGLTSASIAQLVAEAKIDVISVDGLMDNMGTEEYRTQLTDRFTLANQMKSILNTLLLDKTESWDRIEANFSGLPDILKLYLLIAAGAADIPATRFVGQSAVGLSATGEGDLRNHYDAVAAYQANDLTPILSRLDEVLLRSALGNRDPSIYYTWDPLWQMDGKQAVEIAKGKADIFKIDFDAGLIDQEALRIGRENQLIEDGIYPGLADALAVEEPLEEDDPDVLAAAGAPTITPAEQGLNGAQITAMMDIIAAVVDEAMPIETARKLIQLSFPFIDTDLIEQLLAPLEGFEKTAPPPAPGAVPPPPPQPGAEPDDPDANVLPFQRGAAIKAAADALFRAAKDATPRPLYVYRKVANAADIIAWAEAQGFKSTLPASDLHVTVLYSKRPVDWLTMGEGVMYGDADGKLTVPAGGPRIVEPLGEEGAVVLFFAAQSLSWRHCDMCHNGASHDYETYQPHITITYDPGELDLSKVVPYRGPIMLGPEIFEEIKGPFQPPAA